MQHELTQQVLPTLFRRQRWPAPHSGLDPPKVRNIYFLIAYKSDKNSAVRYRGKTYSYEYIRSSRSFFLLLLFGLD